MAETQDTSPIQTGPPVALVSNGRQNAPSLLPPGENHRPLQALRGSVEDTRVSYDEEKYVDSESGKAEAGSDKPDTILTGVRLFLAFVGMLMSVFLISLDQTILSPALPVIASDFNALDKIGWIASAYFITQVGFLLLYGQLLTCFNRRWVFIIAIIIFELGSLICALSPNVISLIIARAIAGVGAGGIFVSCLSLIADVTRLEDRPKLLGSFGGVFAASSVVGPLLGGAFTDHVSWRWCFYINLPIGAVTVLSVIFVIPNIAPPPLSEALQDVVDAKYRRWTGGRYIPTRGTFMHRLGLLDIIGCVLVIGVIVLLVLPLQWGGATYSWTSRPVIGTFIGFAVLLVIWLAWEYLFAGETCVLPLRFFRNPTQIGTCLQAFFLMFAMLVAVYYLPIWFQAVRHSSATRSGIEILPLMLSIVVSAGACGFAISAMGRYWPFLAAGPIITAIGAGLLYTLDEHSSRGALVGFQIIYGAGVGFVLQNTVIAIQANVDLPDVPQATSLLTFFQLVGGTIGIAIAQTMFSASLASNLREYAPDAPFELVRYSVDAIYSDGVSEAVRPGVIKAYALAIRNVYIIGVPAGGLAFFASLLVNNKSIKGQSTGAAAHAG